MAAAGLGKALNQVVWVFSLLSSRGKSGLCFSWVACKVRDMREISLQWNQEISPPLFVLDQAVLEKGGQCQAVAFISKIMYG